MYIETTAKQTEILHKALLNLTGGDKTKVYQSLVDVSNKKLADEIYYWVFEVGEV